MFMPACVGGWVVRGVGGWMGWWVEGEWVVRGWVDGERRRVVPKPKELRRDSPGGSGAGIVAGSAELLWC